MRNPTETVTDFRESVGREHAALGVQHQRRKAERCERCACGFDAFEPQTRSRHEAARDVGPQRIETPDGLGLDGSARALALKGDQEAVLCGRRDERRGGVPEANGEDVFLVKRIGIELLRRVEVDFPQEAGMPCGDEAFESLGARDLAALQERDRGGLDGFVGADETGRVAADDRHPARPRRRDLAQPTEHAGPQFGHERALVNLVDKILSHGSSTRPRWSAIEFRVVWEVTATARKPAEALIARRISEVRE